LPPLSDEQIYAKNNLKKWIRNPESKKTHFTLYINTFFKNFNHFSLSNSRNHDDGQTIRQYESKRTYTRTESSSQPPPNTNQQQQPWSAQNQQKQSQQQVVGQNAGQALTGPQQQQQNRQQIMTNQQYRQTVATGPISQQQGAGQQNGQMRSVQQVQPGKLFKFFKTCIFCSFLIFKLKNAYTLSIPN
jgi:hypothetical protein